VVLDSTREVLYPMQTRAILVCMVFLAAGLGVPLFYNHRMTALAFVAGITAFAAVPLLAGILRSEPDRIMTGWALLMIAFCPVVYVVTEFLDSQFERMRDSYFLATASTIIFLSATWVNYSAKLREWAILWAAIGVQLAATLAVLVMIWMFIYFE
jgi:hypothetical protein